MTPAELNWLQSPPDSPENDQAMLAMQRSWSASYRRSMDISEFTPFADRHPSDKRPAWMP